MLEIGTGTGTGLTGALLAELVGPAGRVVSVDIDPALTSRAARLHSERHVSNVTLVTGDGNQGAPGHGPFGVIIAWATPHLDPAGVVGPGRSGRRDLHPCLYRRDRQEHRARPRHRNR